MTAFSRLGVAAAFAALLSFPLFAQDEKKEEPAKTTPGPLKVPEEKGEKPAAEKPAGEKPAAEKPAEEKPAEETPEKPVDPLVEWKRLADRKIEIFNTLQGLKKKFAAAKDNEAKRIVRNEYTDLIREFETEIYPQMLELADAVWAKDPTSLDAGEIAMKSAFNSNKFAQARDISAALLAAERRTRDVYRMGGMAEFALHNFAKSAEMLEELVKVHKPRDAREEEYLKNYAAEARKYIPFWEKEQAIRANEAALEGAAALPKVEVETTKGKIVIELFEDHAPNTVASFIETVESQKYNGVKFHRVIPAFMAQTGDTTTADDDPLNDDLGGGFTIPCECYTEDTRMHFQGSLSMAHSGKDTGGTQFFITHLPTYWLNYEKDKEDSNHTCFGRVVEGMDVVWSIERNDEIVAAKVLNKRDHEYKADRVSDEEEKPDGTLDPKKTTEGDSKTPEKTTEKKPAEGDKKEADKTEPGKKEIEKKETGKTEPAKKEAVEKKPADSDK
jgi:peptidyl-prolyl cis-trans isomerase B (cyclophilin B)